MNKIDYYAYYVDDKGIMTIYVENNSVAEISECNGLNEEQLEKYRKYVFRKFYYQKGYGDFKQKIFNSMEFGLYCRIQVTNAWL